MGSEIRASSILLVNIELFSKKVLPVYSTNNMCIRIFVFPHSHQCLVLSDLFIYTSLVGYNDDSVWFLFTFPWLLGRVHFHISIGHCIFCVGDVFVWSFAHFSVEFSLTWFLLVGLVFNFHVRISYKYVYLYICVCVYIYIHTHTYMPCHAACGISVLWLGIEPWPWQQKPKILTIGPSGNSQPTDMFCIF